MSNLRDEHKIGVENIDTVISISEQGTLKNLTSREVYQSFLTHGLGFSEKCTVKRWRSCISIDSKITLSHKNTISPGNLKYLLLQNAPEVKRQAQQSTIQVEYAGYQPLQTSIFVAFKGIPAGVPMDGAQKLFVEQVTTDYLDQQTVGLSNVMVIGTKITNQRGRGFDQRRIRSLQEDSAEDDWVEFSIDVLGMLLPPYVGNADFGDIVDDAFRYDRKGYIEDLKTGRNLPGSQVQGERGDYFLDISNISTRSRGSTKSDRSVGGTSYAGVLATASSGTTIFGMPKTVFLLLCVGCIVANAGWIWKFITRTSRKEGIDSRSDLLLDSSEHHRNGTFIFAMFRRTNGTESVKKSTQFDTEVPKRNQPSTERTVPKGETRNKPTRRATS